MKTLKKKGRSCKYCKILFPEEVEMYRSMAHGYYICQECFKDRQIRRLEI